MGSGAQRERLVGRPLNQRATKSGREGRNKAFGMKDKAYEAELRRREKDKVLEDQSGGMQFLEKRYTIQLNRALQHVFENEEATPQEMDYIARQGKVIERFTFPEGLEEDPKAPEKLSEVIITIVDFTRPVV